MKPMGNVGKIKNEDTDWCPSLHIFERHSTYIDEFTSDQLYLETQTLTKTNTGSEKNNGTTLYIASEYEAQKSANYDPLMNVFRR